MTYQVRQAVMADLHVLAPLFDAYRQFYGRSSDCAAARAFLADRFDHGESVLFLAHDEVEAVGFVQLYPSFSSVSLARVLVLNDLFVQKHARGSGVARALIAASAEYGRAVGAVRLGLSTAKTNDAAQALYRSAGWVKDDVFDQYSLALI